MESPQQILEFLDRRFNAIEMPCLGNMNIDYVSSRLLAFRDDLRWLILFNSITWWPAGQGLTTIVECVGNCVQGRQGFDSDHTFITGKIQYDELLELYTVEVRDQPITINDLDIIAHRDLYVDREFDIAIALLENYREDLLASRDEYGKFIPEGLTEVLRLDEWQHPNWDCLPSQTESFPLIAEVLFTGNPNLYKKPQTPNTDWALWFPK
ncbi:DUF7003 family protein [Pseudanabaena sp. ABRG5-3]|uniref:DUF7003 family protein n=1 Tax=Pseudanabaena sp. ABRG5-3 TaxID=685565 RepID=UPI000DC6F3B8|nr:hypothetical protein [Pseudanabaena sp. ABRG5-3]BBC22645.1 hypothetical protein ABRG53_0388 [Pseudanabaena sp. ABRG5-3]